MIVLGAFFTLGVVMGFIFFVAYIPLYLLVSVIAVYLAAKATDGKESIWFQSVLGFIAGIIITYALLYIFMGSGSIQLDNMKGINTLCWLIGLSLCAPLLVGFLSAAFSGFSGGAFASTPAIPWIFIAYETYL